jgi:ATP-dependent DNA helicase HFM1/MER3
MQVHLLSDNQRGATLEAVVSRMKTIQSAPDTVRQSSVANVRFIAVSATIPNAEDVS